MGSINPDSEDKQELDDSGYVQEEGVKNSDKASPSDEPEDSNNGTSKLLELSDDVLLYILRYCSPMDLKALGFTCLRLATLILDRTLWVRVDARSVPSGPNRVRWFLAHGVRANTTALLLEGYANDAKGCLGFIVGSNEKTDEGGSGDGPSTSHSHGDVSESEARGSNANDDERIVAPRLFRLTSQNLPRFGSGTPWTEPSPERAKRPSNLVCRGPRVTMTQTALKHLVDICPRLEQLALDHCIIDCATVNISMFPKYLKKLSLRGSKCFNLEKSFLFKIQDHLTELEELDLSYCEWVEPACMLPLSKLPSLHSLYMRECPKLSEFVAYASLATRYGFKTLKVLDLRGCPVGDSEVSALGWLPLLEQLSLARAEPRVPRADHAHYTRVLDRDRELSEWEQLEPDFFKNKASDFDGCNDDQNPKMKNIPNAPIDANNQNPYVFLERMVAEPVGPDEYSQVYQRFLSETPSAPLATPDEYRQAYVSYLTRNRPYISPTGYIIANPSSNRRVSNINADENGNENGPNANENDPQNEAGPSCERIEPKSDENDKQAHSSKDDEPTPKKAKIDESGPLDSNGKSNDNNLPGQMGRSSRSNRNFVDECHISDDDSDDDGPPKSKKARLSAPNGTSSSSKMQKNPENNDDEPSTSTCQNASPRSTSPKKQRYIRFRQNQPPVVIEELQNGSNNNEESNNDDNNAEGPNEPGPSNDRQEPKHRILVVNVGVRRHAMYQLSLPVCTVAEPVDLRTNNFHPLSRNVSSLIYASQLSSRLDHGALVTDSAIQRFGRADGENVSYVQIGPNGPIPAPYHANNDRNARPDRSNLRRLSVTGFRHVTDASLNHLATAAPHLQFVDFTDTGVTEAGVEQFKSLRPDVEVKHSPFDKKKKDPS